MSINTLTYLLEEHDLSKGAPTQQVREFVSVAATHADA